MPGIIALSSPQTVVEVTTPAFQGFPGPAGPTGPAPTKAHIIVAVEAIVGQPGGIAGQDELAAAEAALGTTPKAWFDRVFGVGG